MSPRYTELRARFHLWLSSDYNQTSLPQAAVDTLREFLGLTDGMAGDFGARCRDLEAEYNRRLAELKASFDYELESLRFLVREARRREDCCAEEVREACAKLAEDPYSEAVACEGSMEPTEVGMWIADAIRGKAPRGLGV